MTDKENELKLLGTDTEDGITCEIRGYRKDGICYVKDVINKRSEDRKHITPSAKPSDEVLTYENGFERGKQVGYKEGRRNRGKDTTEEREVVEIKKKFIDELIEQCYPYDERNHNSIIGEDRLKEIRKSLD